MTNEERFGEMVYAIKVTLLRQTSGEITPHEALLRIAETVYEMKRTTQQHND